jgi:hypothetical protein
MRRLALALAGLLAAGAASAAETGCDRLAWTLDAERALLAAATPNADRASPPAARRLTMMPLAQAGFALPPERAPREPGALGGVVRVSVPEAGLYRVTLDAEGWLDVVQNGAHRGADAFTGVRECPGLRKSVKFRLEAGEAAIQVTGTAPTIGLAFTRDQ